MNQQQNFTRKNKAETRSPLASGERVSAGLSDPELAIFATIAYYDYFSYPLTAVEVYQYLIKLTTKDVIAIRQSAEKQSRSDQQKHEIASSSFDSANASLMTPRNDRRKPAFFDILKILDERKSLEKLIGQKNGFYFLSGREEIITARIQRKKLADQKFKKSKWILKFIYYMPFTRLVMISGTTAIGNPYKESDIDLLVVAKAGRIWTTRALLTFFTMTFGKYRHKGKTENRLCLNHYITDKSLAIDFGNLYKAQEYLNLLPVAGEMKIYDEFFASNQNWMKNYVCFAGGDNRENLRTFQPPKSYCKYFFEYLLSGAAGDYFEGLLRNLEIFFIRKNPLTNHPLSRIRYDDNNLVFHPVLVEPEVIGKYEEKLAELDMNLS